MADWVVVAHKIKKYAEPLGKIIQLEMIDINLALKILLEKFNPQEIQQIRQHVIRANNRKNTTNAYTNHTGEPSVEKFLEKMIMNFSEKFGSKNRKRKSKRSRKSKQSKKKRRTRK